MNPEEPAGTDSGGGEARRIRARGTGCGWVGGEHPPDCLRERPQGRYLTGTDDARASATVASKVAGLAGDGL